MSILSRLFGGKSKTETAEPIDYNGFRIFAAPIQEGGKYRLSALIERDVDGDVKSHQVIRADTLDSLEQATEVSITKAKQVIDEQGDRLFR